MSSTERPADAGHVFDAHVAAAPVDARVRARVLPEPDPAAASYLVTRTRRTLVPADFEWPAVSSIDELRARLTDLWAGQPELLRLVEPLLTLARVPEDGHTPSGAVPDHLYPMY